MPDASMPPAAARLSHTLRAALSAGLLVGLFQGTGDGLVAARELELELGLDYLGCLAASALLYALGWCAALLVLALPVHVLLGRRSPAVRARALLALGLGLAAFFELYWWTRPYVYWGLSSVAPERLAATAGLLALGLVLGWAASALCARAPRAWLTGLGVCAAAVALAGLGWLGLERSRLGELARGELGERNRELPNVLLIVVDALRADTIGFAGDARARTPHMDELARRGVVFERAYTQAPFTWPSFGSILTGKYPRRHGLVKMESGIAMVPSITLPHHLKTAQRRAGGHMQDRDWASATFMTGTLSHGSGLMRGFDAYFEALKGHDLVELDSAWSQFRSRLLASKVYNKLSQRLDSGLVATTADAWLARQAGRRKVAMVHLYSTHTPYDPVEPYRSMYVDPAYAGPISAFYAQHREAIERGEYEPTPADLQQVRDLYYGGVSQADAAIGQLLDGLRERGELEDTLVILTSDHGENLGERGPHGEVLLEHNHMNQLNLRVPLVLSWPRGLPQGKRVAALVESVDLLPTVCDLFELELPRDEAAGERGLIDGHSLLPLVRGERESLREYAFAENGVHLSAIGLEHSLVVRAEAFKPGQEQGGGWVANVPPRLYALEADPLELHSVHESEPQVLERMLAALRAWDARMPIPRANVVRSHRDLEEEERMRALGYTGGVGGEFEDAAKPPAPSAPRTDERDRP
jgi:arylsulfatase